MSINSDQSSIIKLLSDAAQRIAKDGANEVSSSVLTIVADHLRASLEASAGATTLNQLEAQLRRFFREALAASPPEARAAAQGAGAPETAAAFLLGQAAFAHLLAARVLDTRVEPGFLAMLDDKRYTRYFQALLDGPKDGLTLAVLVAETPETVSRKLGILRDHGLVTARQEGRYVVNKLAPPTRAMLVHKGVEPLAMTSASSTEVDRALADLVKGTPKTFREKPVIGGFARKKAA